MPRCSVPGCDNDSKDPACAHLSWFHFPRDSSLRRAWLNRISRLDYSTGAYDRVCSDHFEDCCFERDLQAEFAAAGEISGYSRRRPRRLNLGSVPSLKLRGKADTQAKRGPSTYFQRRDHDQVESTVLVCTISSVMNSINLDVSSRSV